MTDFFYALFLGMGGWAIVALILTIVPAAIRKYKVKELNEVIAKAKAELEETKALNAKLEKKVDELEQMKVTLLDQTEKREIRTDSLKG